MTNMSPRVLSILRIVTALLFMEHGLMKLFHFPIAQPGVPDPLPPMLMIAAVLEIVGGTLLAVGLFTRVVAFLASGEMAAAYFIGHLPSGYLPGVNGGGEAILYCFIFLHLASSGGGPWSVDANRSSFFPHMKESQGPIQNRTVSDVHTEASRLCCPNHHWFL